MNKEQQEIIDGLEWINSNYKIDTNYIAKAIVYIKQLSTINPMKIDEERMKEVYRKIHPMNFYEHSQIKIFIEKYNSTLEDHQCKYCKAMTSQPDEECYLAPQVLQPLPKDKPDWFEWSLDTSKYDLWDKLIKEYGTPTKKELVSVDELEKEIRIAYNKVDSSWKSIAQHIIDTYSLNPAKREWWMDCEKFMYNGKAIDCHGYNVERSGLISLYNRVYGAYTLKDCTPYIEPSIHDKVKEKLGIELYDEFMKEVKGGM